MLVHTSTKWAQLHCNRTYVRYTHGVCGGSMVLKNKPVCKIRRETEPKWKKIKRRKEKKNLTFVIIVLFVFSYIKLLAKLDGWVFSFSFSLSLFSVPLPYFVVVVVFFSLLLCMREIHGLHSICFVKFIHLCANERIFHFFHSVCWFGSVFCLFSRLVCVS